jgi:cysteinyl-tRNA synthetase
MLSTHYRNPLNFTDEALVQAQNSIDRIANCRKNVQHLISQTVETTTGNAAAKMERLQAIRQMFHAKMSDDFNTPDAITAMFELVAEANALMGSASSVGSGVPPLTLLREIEALFLLMDQVLGILPEADEELLDAEVERLISERTEARKARNFQRADEIRDQLTAQGILLEDTVQGIRWRRKT